jgi:iron complex transport system substrate-binding protein
MKAVSFAFLFLTASLAVAEPLRVATLLPYVEDALGHVDGRVVVVATVRREMSMPPATPRIDLGSAHSPNFERLAEARPQLIVGDRALHGAIRERLERTGAEVLLIDSSTVDSTFDGLATVARRAGAQDPMAKEIAAARAKIGASTLAQPVPTLVLFGAPGSFLVVTDRTWLGDLLRRLNFDNVGARVTGSERHPGFVGVSDEVLSGLRPELVLLVAHGDPEALRVAFERKLAEGGAWTGLRSAAKRGVHILPGALFTTNPGLGMAESAGALHDLATP